MKCAAYSKNNIRCNNEVTGNSNHCELHRKKAIKLYFKYKNLCAKCDLIYENINNYIIDEEDDIDNQIDEIMNYYLLCNDAFLARKKHRQYAFVSDLHDSGHDYQFTKLNDYLIKCENILSKLFSINDENNDENNDDKNREEILDKKITLNKNLETKEKFSIINNVESNN
jgi:hypothetical protein